MESECTQLEYVANRSFSLGRRVVRFTSVERFMSQTVFIPALISLVLYLVLSYGVIPFVRRYRHRYHQYLPLEQLSSRTTSFRQRIADGLTALVLPSTWLMRRRRARETVDGSSELQNGNNNDDVDDEDDDGGVYTTMMGNDGGDGNAEHMASLELDSRRREALEGRRSELGDGDRRLSRDLEEGFRDDSDDEDENGGDERRHWLRLHRPSNGSR